MPAKTIAEIMIAILLSNSLWDNYNVDSLDILNILNRCWMSMRHQSFWNIILLYILNHIELWSDVHYVKEKFMIPQIVSFMMVIDLIESHAYTFSRSWVSFMKRHLLILSSHNILQLSVLFVLLISSNCRWKLQIENIQHRY